MAEWVFLGTGTSHGVPMVACDCEVCTSASPYDNRTRTSSMIHHEGRVVLLDVSIDFRAQGIRENIRRLDAVCVTHPHADHIFGLDEIRRFNYVQPDPIPIYGEAPTLERLRHVFDYVFNPVQEGGGVPKISLHEINGPFNLFGLPVEPLRILHGKLPITAFRIGPVAYLTDCSFIPEETYARLHGLEVLILGALRIKPHPTHFNLEQALEAAERIGAPRTYFVHISHALGHEATNASLPGGVRLAHDGLRFPFEVTGP